MISMCRILLLFGICVTSLFGQNMEDDVFHFTNSAQGNAVWILDESALPWSGGYKFLRSLSGMPTTLLSIVDSSTGATLGQCVAPQQSVENQTTKQWESFNWEVTKHGLSCIFGSGSIPSNVQFQPSANPRTLSIRIQSVTGPACLRDLNVQNEQPVGCPPHLSKNSFIAINFNCTCPYLDSSAAPNEDAENENEDVDMLAANSPQFPLFKGIDPSAFQTTAWTLSPSPCAGHECYNNGTCLVSQEGTATCLCRNGFAGDQCESDICEKVPCQNGGVCRSKDGHAFCDCPSGFSGLLCQATSAEEDEATTISSFAILQKCTPECSNGDCVIVNGRAQCECRQGFTGLNCNVLDVCLGDAACSMFGANAKCVLDDNMDKMISPTLMNGTYDCLCPHPIHGQFVDCMQLHAPVSTSPSDKPSFPVLEISQLPTTETTPSVVATTQAQGQASQNAQTNGFTVTREPMRPVEITFGTTLPPPFNHRIITAGEPVQETSMPVNNVSPQTQTTFIFPQTFETTTAFVDTTQHQSKFVQPNQPSTSTDADDEEEEEEDDMDHEEDSASEFPTPSTMNIVPQTGIETTSSFVSETTTTFPSTQQTTTEMEDEDEDDMTTEEETTVTGASTTTTSFENVEEDEEEKSPTTQFVPSTTTNTQISEEDSNMGGEASSEASQETPQPSSTLPFWMTATTTQPTPQEVITTTRMIMPNVQPEQEIVTIATTTTEEQEEEEAEEEQETTHASSSEVLATKRMEVSTPSDVVHHHTINGKQSSAAASWIIAISAVIALGLLLLALSLIILRYIRQSRKLHGKYNPAREEHNLSAAYAMPMSHITKEERLI